MVRRTPPESTRNHPIPTRKTTRRRTSTPAAADRARRSTNLEARIVELVDKQLDLALNDRYDAKINMTTARYLTDRCLGPPTQRTELTGPGGGPVSIAYPRDR
jgi:hypothetical protein